MANILNSVRFDIATLYITLRIAETYRYYPLDKQLRNIYLNFGKIKHIYDIRITADIKIIMGVVRCGIGNILIDRITKALGIFFVENNIGTFTNIDVKDEMFDIVNNIIKNDKGNDKCNIGESIARELCLLTISKRELIKPIVINNIVTKKEYERSNEYAYQICKELVTFEPIETPSLMHIMPLQVANYLSAVYQAIDLLHLAPIKDKEENKLLTIIDSFWKLVKDFQNYKDYKDNKDNIKDNNKNNNKDDNKDDKKYIKYVELFDSDLIIDYFPNYIPNVIFNIIKSYDLIHDKDIMFKRVLKF